LFDYRTSAGANAAGYRLSETSLARVWAFGDGLLRELH
jgi:hypothetical protein